MGLYIISMDLCLGSPTEKDCSLRSCEGFPGCRVRLNLAPTLGHVHHYAYECETSHARLAGSTIHLQSRHRW